MARTLATIKTEITGTFMGNGSIAGLYGFEIGADFDTTFSNLSVENILFNVVAYVVFTHELLFDTHKSEVDTALFNQKRYRKPWYADMAKKFQYGHALVTETDYYDNTGYTDLEITTAQVVKYSAVTESDSEARVIIKIAGEANNELAPIGANEQAAFENYIERIKPAGVATTVINFLPDKLFLELQIIRDPLVIDANGLSILQGTYPVEEAIQEYMKLLPFDGEFVVAHFVDHLQKVNGVIIPHVVNIQSSWIDTTIGDYGNPISIPIRKIPESGYFKVESFDNITYTV